MKLADWKIGIRPYLSFGIVIAMLVALVATAYVNFARLGTVNGWNAHTNEVLQEVDGLLTALVNIEAGERGFALTGKDDSLEPFNAGKTEIGGAITTVMAILMAIWIARNITRPLQQAVGLARCVA